MSEINDNSGKSAATDTAEDAVPALQPLPLDGWHRARGARMVPFAGYEMPVQYEGIIAEHQWTRTRAGFFDISHMGQLLVSGAAGENEDTDENEDDAAMVRVQAALEALIPADLAALPPGGMRYSLLLNEDGGILDDLIVTRWRRGFHLIVNGATKWDDIAHLREHLPDEVTLAHHDEQALFALQGPEAAEALAALAIAPAAADTVQPAGLHFMQMGLYTWQGRPLAISRSGYTGEDGFEISVPAGDAAALADALCALPQVKPIGLGARDSLRLEAGLPLYGHDLDEEIDPVSAGLGFAISRKRRDSGGFPGAERILRLLKEGTPRIRVGLALAGRQVAREGARVIGGAGEGIGTVTSGGFSPGLGHAIAMAHIDRAHAAPGTALAVEVRGKPLPATVTALPFLPHRYHRSHGKA